MKRTKKRVTTLLTPTQFRRLFGLSRRALAGWRALGLPTARVAGRTRYPKALCIRWLIERGRRGSPPWRPTGLGIRQLG